MKKSISNAFIGFIAGAAAGTIVGILYAPNKGSRTRRKIRKKTHRLSSDVMGSINSQVDNMKRNVNDFVEDIKDKIETLESDIKEKVSEQQKKAAAAAKVK
jgi:gas vesicle protein